MSASPLLSQHLDQLSQAGPMLDLACGGGRNGLFLLQHGIPVVFADSNRESLQRVRATLEEPQYRVNAGLAELWEVDFEQPHTRPLQGRDFGAILVFRYLHRPLFPSIKLALRPGGLLIYETFTRGQALMGRPTNPDFLLQDGELEQQFAAWDILHSFEGTVETPPNRKPSAIAQLVARKPPPAP